MKLFFKPALKRPFLKFIKTKTKKGMFSYGSYLQQRKALSFFSYNSILKYNVQAKNLIGKPSNNLLLLFENRLDTTLCRIRFAQSILQARQFIYHKKIKINGNPVTVPSYQLKPGDILCIKVLSFFFTKKSNISSFFNYEINFVTGTAIFLYPPQKLYYSQRLYPDLIRRSFN